MADRELTTHSLSRETLAYDLSILANHEVFDSIFIASPGCRAGKGAATGCNGLSAATEFIK